MHRTLPEANTLPTEHCLQDACTSLYLVHVVYLQFLVLLSILNTQLVVGPGPQSDMGCQCLLLFQNPHDAEAGDYGQLNGHKAADAGAK